MGATQNGRGGHEWAPRSPDLTVCDFALWPLLKKRVYTYPRPTTLEELELRILHEIAQLNQEEELIKRCHLSVRRRAESYIQKFGGHF